MLRPRRATLTRRAQRGAFGRSIKRATRPRSHCIRHDQCRFRDAAVRTEVWTPAARAPVTPALRCKTSTHACTPPHWASQLGPTAHAAVGGAYHSALYVHRHQLHLATRLSPMFSFLQWVLAARGLAWVLALRGLAWVRGRFFTSCALPIHAASNACAHLWRSRQLVGGRADGDDARSLFLDRGAPYSSLRAATMKTLTCTFPTWLCCS